MGEKRVNWKKFAFNTELEELGYIQDSLWFQFLQIRMSPGCLQEVVDMFGTKDKDVTELKYVNKTDRKVYVWDKKETDILGTLLYENVGSHMHWCWYQGGFGLPKKTLLAIREKQKELIMEKRNKKGD